MLIAVALCFIAILSGHPAKVKGAAERDITVCEGLQHTISCLNGKIKIQDAAFGRSRPNICPGIINNHVTNCRAANSLSIIQEECDGFQKCTLTPSVEVFGDPCFLVKKYLTVTYTCEGYSNPTKKATFDVCENNGISLNCPGKRKIRISFANYGRLEGGHICPALQVVHTSCSAAGSMEKVQNECDGKDHCVLDATVAEFGNPCWFTRKYLEVEYSCK